MSETRSSPQASTGRQPAEVSISNTRQIDFTSTVNGRDYRIQVALPRVPPPEKGYPVLYVLDGFGYFASATEAVRGNANAPHVAVVGIGYPFSVAWADGVLDRHFRGHERPMGMPAIGAAAELARFYDLTLPADDEALAAQSFPAAPKQFSSDVGGLDDFLKVIEAEIKPRVRELAPVDISNQVLFGHSLGGLASLHALFVEPDAFCTFIVASPSIWWNERSVLASEPSFTASVNSGQARPRALFTVGALEDEPPAHLDPPLVVTAETAKFFARTQMVQNGRELVDRLKALKGEPPFEVADYLVFAGQGHGVSAWSALAAAIVFAFQTPMRP
jgi:predicted alpha/beta superfamily hydrolase